MSSPIDKSVELFMAGYNCAQSIVGGFCDEVGLDFDTAIKISSSFGAGMGRLRETCGTVTGSFMILGLKYGYTDPKDIKSKTQHYKLIQLYAQKYKDIYGTINCFELLKRPKGADNPQPDKRDEQYYKIRPCVALVRGAAQLLDSFLKENPIKED